MTPEAEREKRAEQTEAQRARELLAHEFSKRGQPSVALMLRSAPTFNEDGPYAAAVAAIVAAFAEAERLTVQEGWKPIESAPRDGTRILLWLNLDFPMIYRWDGARWRDDEALPLNMAWATHWMPLPAAPSSTRQALGEDDG